VRRGNGGVVGYNGAFANVHLFASKDETLLHWWNAFFFFDLLLDLCDLYCALLAVACVANGETHLVVGLDVELNLLAGKSSDPVSIC
jgi:hypothetical protein